MENMNITFAMYALNEAKNDSNGVLISIDGGNIFFVPLDPANRHYAEIMRQVEAGTLIIQPADEPEQPEEPNA